MNELYITSKNLIFIILNILLFSVIIYILFCKNTEGFSEIEDVKPLESDKYDIREYREEDLNQLKTEVDQIMKETNEFKEQTTQMENQTKEIEKETQEIETEITELEKIFESISI